MDISPTIYHFYDEKKKMLIVAERFFEGSVARDWFKPRFLFVGISPEGAKEPWSGVIVLKTSFGFDIPESGYHMKIPVMVAKRLRMTMVQMSESYCHHCDGWHGDRCPGVTNYQEVF